MNQENGTISVPIGRNPAIGDDPKGLHPAVPGGSTTYHTPPIDIHEGPEGLVLEADLPGVSEGQVSIQLEDNVLSLHARVGTPAPEGARVVHEEYRPGDFYRSFILSDEVERSRISAEMKNGVLRLNLPKAERAKTRRIEIKTS
ncbi:Hsp20/alpha crystallin family protein [Tundrisphaera lichenicola]|uniref:Hsp20/alpha crystallin family protein n=1 Tax=Tundrisphaera lichenicola TaxID=2029860 RepID=UPI003EB9AD78